jgi:hypothetical protein
MCLFRGLDLVCLVPEVAPRGWTATPAVGSSGLRLRDRSDFRSLISP